MLPDRTPVLALIPARGGSKGIPRKNLAILLGKPLLAFSVEAALASSWIDQVWVSSDDDEILSVADRLGARPLKRPPAIAGDHTSAIEVVEHFIEQLPGELRERDPLVVYLQPTSPLRTAAHLDAAFQQLSAAGGRTLMSVTECEKSPFKAFGIDSSRKLQSLFDEKLSNARRQDLPPTYLPNGAIYIFGISDFVERGGFPSNGSLPFIMSASESVDIDTPDDLRRVEHILGEQHG